MANGKYQKWMEKVNEVARKNGRICCQNKYTWAAFRSGMKPQQYVTKVLKL